MTDDTQMKIRLPKVLKERIDTAARISNRSLNGEIVSRLVESFAGTIDPNDAALSRRAMRTPAANDYVKRLDLLEARLDDALVPDFVTGDRIDALSSEVEQLREQVRALSATVRKQGAS